MQKKNMYGRRYGMSNARLLKVRKNGLLTPVLMGSEYFFLDQPLNLHFANMARTTALSWGAVSVPSMLPA